MYCSALGKVCRIMGTIEAALSQLMPATVAVSVTSTFNEGETNYPVLHYLYQRLTAVDKASLWLCLYALLEGKPQYFYLTMVTLFVSTPSIAIYFQAPLMTVRQREGMRNTNPHSSIPLYLLAEA